MFKERKGKYMNQIKNVSSFTGGGGEPLNRVHYGGNPVIPHNYRRSRSNNVTKFDGQH